MTCAIQEYNLCMCVMHLKANLRFQPPVLRNQFSKIPKVSKLSHYTGIWNLLWANACHKHLLLQSRPLLEVKFCFVFNAL